MSNSEFDKKHRLRAYYLMVFAHHPLCGFFDSHYYSIGPVKLCKGCTAGYSGLFSGLTLLILGLLPGFLLIDNIKDFLLVFGLAFTITGVYEVQKKRVIPRFPIRFMSGTLFVVAIYSLIQIQSWFYRYMVLVFIFAVINIVGFLRFKKMNSICGTNCGDRRFDRCDYVLGLQTPPELLLAMAST
ncbi:MAG: hypothetical protein IH840_03875 [Candidatus Heimdallarchaeota archaeon]|nr:hypothetical protein [Candidatus Heimdallarchaeota archaeon]